MRAFVSVLIAVFVALSSSVLAQWPSWPTPDVPRTADGKPNLNAPPPRTADGRIDLSGLWEAPFGGAFVGFVAEQRSLPDPRGAARAGGAGRGGAAAAGPTGEPPLAAFFDIGAKIPGGAPMQPWAAELKKQRMASNMAGNPSSNCLPMGHMQLWLYSQPRKIVQTPREILMIWEANHGLRHVFTDGRPSPDNDPQPWWYGYTIGRWEGDTLVAVTTNLRDGMWLDFNGTPLTDQGRITERFRRPTYGSLEIDITIDDPKAFTRPFTVRVNQNILLDSNLMEFICNENEQSSKHYVKSGP